MSDIELNIGTGKQPSLQFLRVHARRSRASRVILSPSATYNSPPNILQHFLINERVGIVGPESASTTVVETISSTFGIARRQLLKKMYRASRATNPVDSAHLLSLPIRLTRPIPHKFHGAVAEFPAPGPLTQKSNGRAVFADQHGASRASRPSPQSARRSIMASETATDHTLAELMTVQAGRELKDGEVVFRISRRPRRGGRSPRSRRGQSRSRRSASRRQSRPRPSSR